MITQSKILLVLALKAGFLTLKKITTFKGNQSVTQYDIIFTTHTRATLCD